MCLAVPGKIISIDEKEEDIKMAKVSFGGTIKDVCLDLVPEAKIGDFVIVHVGFALNTLDEDEAKRILEIYSELTETQEE